MITVTGGVLAVVSILAIAASDPGDNKRVVADLGLTPSAFAASGFDAAGVAAVLDRIKGSSSVSTIIILKSQLRGQERLVAEMAKRDREGTPEPAEGSQISLAEARAAVVQTKAELRVAVETLFSAAIAECTAALRDKLTAFRANGSAGISAEFRVVNWTGTELTALQKALIAESRANQGREVLKQEHRSVLEAARARAAVADATAALDANLSAVTQQFETSLGS